MNPTTNQPDHNPTNSRRANTLLFHPVPQRTRMKTQIPGHLGNRFPSLQNNPYRPRLELRVVPSTYLRHKLLL